MLWSGDLLISILSIFDNILVTYGVVFRTTLHTNHKKPEAHLGVIWQLQYNPWTVWNLQQQRANRWRVWRRDRGGGMRGSGRTRLRCRRLRPARSPVSTGPRPLHLFSQLCRQGLQDGAIDLGQRRDAFKICGPSFCESVLSVQLLTCEGDGTSMLRLSCSRGCFGVCLKACRSLLVPGTGSGED